MEEPLLFPSNTDSNLSQVIRKVPYIIEALLYVMIVSV